MLKFVSTCLGGDSGQNGARRVSSNWLLIQVDVVLSAYDSVNSLVKTSNNRSTEMSIKFDVDKVEDVFVGRRGTPREDCLRD